MSDPAIASAPKRNDTFSVISTHDNTSKPNLHGHHGPLVSVLLTSYNHEKFAATAINSILSQRGNFNLQIVFCDDNSSDRTLEIASGIAERDPRLMAIARSENLGMVRNFLDGLARCKGSFIAYCDGDDFWLDNDKLQTQINALLRNPECSFSFHDMIHADVNGELSTLWSIGRRNAGWREGVKSPDDFLTPSKIVFHASSVVFKRDAIDLDFLHSIDSSIRGLDFAIAVMLGSAGKGYYFPQPMAAYRKHASSQSAASLTAERVLSIQKEVSSLKRTINRHYGAKFRHAVASNRQGHLIDALYFLARTAASTQSPKDYWLYFRVALGYILTWAVRPGDFWYITKAELLRCSRK